MKISAIITAAGSGKRCNLSYNKLLYNIGNMLLIEKTVSAFLREDISSITITSSCDDIDLLKNVFKNYHKDIRIIEGGKTRQESVCIALSSLDEDTDFALIHDGARPFVSQKIITDAINMAKEKNNATVAIACTDSMRVINNDSTRSVERTHYMRVQTPQIFDYKTIYNCHLSASEKKLEFSDDASLFEYFGNRVYLSQGSEENIKITTQKDLELFKPNNAYCGVGWDTHELVENRKLILGGVEIPHTKGLLGHSDADVLIHAIMDALLSASHNRDIGQLFPDSSEEFKGISSLILLEKVATLLKNDGYEIGNISAVIMAQKPKLANYIPIMQKTLADCLNISENKLTISATTTEKLGLCGKEEAISSNAYCILYKKNGK